MNDNDAQEPALDFDDVMPRLPVQYLDESLFDLGAEERVHVVFERDWLGAVFELSGSSERGEEFNWALPGDLRVGDVVLTAVGHTNPFIVCIERVQKLGETAHMDPSDVLVAPVLVASLEIASGIEITSGRALSGPEARTVLGLFKRLAESQEPVLVEVPDCGRDFDFADWSYVMGTRVLQHAILEKQNSCSGCGAEIGSLEPHALTRFAPGVKVELQDLVAALELLCSTCHEFFHGSSMELLKRLRRPACPECGASNPKEYCWGMQPFDLDEEKYVVAGCCVPDGVWPQWHCRECDTSFSVTSIPKYGYLQAMGHDGKPLLHH